MASRQESADGEEVREAHVPRACLCIHGPRKSSTQVIFVYAWCELMQAMFWQVIFVHAWCELMQAASNVLAEETPVPACGSGLLGCC